MPLWAPGAGVATPSARPGRTEARFAIHSPSVSIRRGGEDRGTSADEVGFGFPASAEAEEDGAREDVLIGFCVSMFNLMRSCFGTYGDHEFWTACASDGRALLGTKSQRL